MTDRERHIQQVFTAELQFRLASAVRLAVRGNRQPLDLPMEWTHGQHRVQYEETALRQDQDHRRLLGARPPSCGMSHRTARLGSSDQCSPGYGAREETS